MIREYRNEDQQELLDAWWAASEVAHPFLPDDFQKQERINIVELYLPNTETWVWEHEGRVVGFIAMMGSEIGGLFLQPEFHGQGIGRALVDMVRKQKGQLTVEVFENNQIGRAFYDKYGFELVEKSIHEKTGQPLLKLELCV